jgi:hypothetical protein
MNLFAIHSDPVTAARQACDKHVVKMPTETAQMLAFIAHRNPDQDWSSFPRRHPDGSAHPYSGKGSHKNHPATLWVGSTRANWEWTVSHGLGLCAEYTRRYGKVHKAEAIIGWLRDHTTPPALGPLEPFAQCMPEEYRRPDPVEGYRAFYLGDKARFATWKPPATPPDWWVPALREVA